MNSRLNISERGIALIAKFEGFSADWYKCPAGKLTIGYGHVRKSNEIIEAPISEQFARSLLRRDAHHAAEAVRDAVKVPLEQHEFDALAAFVFNVGDGAFKESTLLKLLNSGGKLEAAEQFGRWVKGPDKNGDGVKDTIPGLVTRRAAEKKLFLGANRPGTT